jgi:hypothetical protein
MMYGFANFARHLIRNTDQAPQALLVPAYLVGTMFTVLALLACLQYGEDRHVWDVPVNQFENLAFSAWLSEMSFLISTCCTKISILLFYRRLVVGTFTKRWKYATFGAIVFTALYCIAFSLALILNCHPLDAYWKAYDLEYMETYHCINTKPLNPVAGLLSVISDLYAVFLPMVSTRTWTSSGHCCVFSALTITDTHVSSTGHASPL